MFLGQFSKSVLCVPILTPDNDCLAVIELYKQLHQDPFSNDDLQITTVISGWMGAAIHQNQQRVALKKQQDLNEYLLNLTKNYFSETLNVEKMISDIVVNITFIFRLLSSFNISFQSFTSLFSSSHFFIYLFPFSLSFNTVLLYPFFILL